MAQRKFLDDGGLLYFWQQLKAKLLLKADKTYVDDELKKKQASLSEQQLTNISNVPNKLDSSTFDSFKLTNEQALKGKVASTDFEKFKKENDTALGNKVDTTTFQEFQESNTEALNQKVETTTYDEFVQSTNQSLGTKVDKKLGYSLTKNDLTDNLKAQYDKAQENVIEKITLNGVMVSPSGKTVALTVITATQVDNKIKDAIGKVKGLEFKKVEVLPPTGEANIIYLVPKDPSGDKNIYTEYIYVDNAFEAIGDTAIDLSGYLQEKDFVKIENSEIDGILKQ